MSNHDDDIKAVFYLQSVEGIVGNDGLNVRKVRVELSVQGLEGNWISELVIEGELPVRLGEERQVLLRIMSDKFRDYVIGERPGLNVTRGGVQVGYLSF